ncbi:hypothetical protein U9M48_035629, partial [Paspalum notatum var. saurae]
NRLNRGRTEEEKEAEQKGVVASPDSGTHDFDGSELIHDQFMTHLTLSSSNYLVMNGEETTTSRSPDKTVPSAILNWPIKTVRKDDTEEAIKWRLEKNGFPILLSDSEWGDSSNDSSHSEQSSIISTPSTPFTVQSDTQSEDLDRTDIWVSSLNLDAEDCALLPVNEQFPDIFSYDFPSPSFCAVRRLQFGPSSSNTGTSQRNEATDPDEPIFWPFEQTSYHSPEIDKFLSVSPRRNTMDIGYAEVRQLNPVLQRLHNNKLSSLKKSVEMHRGTTGLDAKGTKASYQAKIHKVPAVPSRLSRTTKASASSSHHHVPSIYQKRRPPHLTLDVPRKVSSRQLQEDQFIKLIEAGDNQNLADKKSQIEEMIGLDEFNGHEGICSDLSAYQFSLWLSPR